MECIWDKKKSVLLIDEIDKADIEFPNDLLQELDKMEFYVYETGQTIKADNDQLLLSLQIMKKNYLRLF